MLYKCAMRMTCRANIIEFVIIIAVYTYNQFVFRIKDPIPTPYLILLKMAALLKKRAVAEFSQTIQEEPKPVKKLRIVQKSPPREIHLTLSGSTSTHETLQRLLSFEENFPTQGEDVGNAVRELLDHYHREKEAVLRWKIAGLLGRIAKLPTFNSDSLTEDIVNLLKSEKSNKAISKLLEALVCIGKSAPFNHNLHLRIINIAKQYLKNTNHLAKCSCLNLIGELGTPDMKIEEKSLSEDTVTVLDLLTGFSKDHDPRVRSSALEAMQKFHQRGLPLGQAIYQQACAALTDDYEGVRLVAIKLVWVVSHLYPDSTVKVSDSDQELRLVDDGFAKICNMVNDISVKVRVEAATLLGSLHQVSAKFLEQTLDKKLMSNMRRKESAHERAKDHFSSGQWATGQKWADDTPKEEVDPENVSLMNIGACGAFVHGTEDEFLEVRNAALDSLCELAAQSEAFANLSQDCIIDMFNDEIESVRQNAINSLRKLSHMLSLREDQLDIMLGVLQDFSHTSRESLRDMLCEMKLSTKECLKSCVMGLMDNLRRYPQDRLSVWSCMQHLGKNHPHLTLPLVPELLCLHPYFDTPEPDMDDPAYISILLLVFNAAAHCPTMIPMFQDHIWRQYSYLLDSIPEMLPKLQIPGKTATEQEEPADVTGSSTEFVQNSLHQLSNLENMDLSTAQKLLEMLVRDLEHVSKLDKKTSASSECICLFLKCQLLLTQLMNQKYWTCSCGISNDKISSTTDVVLEMTQQLQNVFLGLGSVELGLVHQTQLKAQTLQVVSKLQTGSEKTSVLRDCFIKRLKQLQNYISLNQIQPDPFSTHLFSVMEKIEKCNVADFLKNLQYSLKFIKPCAFPVNNQIRKAQAVLHEPTGISDNPIKFSAGLTSAVAIDTTLDNIQNTNCIKIQVKYPDQQKHLISPRAGDFQRLGPLRHRLQSEVVISHSLWSDPTHVEVCIVVEAQVDHSLLSGEEDNSTPSALELCPPVKVLVAPKPVKR